MLPDFAGMAGLRLSPVSGPLPLLQGVALHHRTDEAFHGSPVFLELMDWTTRALTGSGVARGPARAVGHVGVELLVDGELLRADDVAAAYREALTHSERVHELFEDSAQLARWIVLERHLHSHGVPYDYRNTDAVVRRLSRIFADRPRLALDESAERAVRGVLPELQHKVVARLPELLSRVRQQLESTASPANESVLV